MRRTSVELSVCSLLLLLPSAATAQAAPHPRTAPPSWKVEAGAALVSDYRFRGVSLSEGSPALQATAGIAHHSGPYVHAFVSSVEMGGHGRQAEVDVQAGIHRSVGRVTVDLAAMAYAFTAGHDPYLEVVAGLSGEALGLGWEVGGAFAPPQGALHEEASRYATAALVRSLAPPVTLGARIGAENGAFGAPEGTRWSWEVGASLEVLRVRLDVGWVDTRGPGEDGDGGLVVGLATAF